MIALLLVGCTAQVEPISTSVGAVIITRAEIVTKDPGGNEALGGGGAPIGGGTFILMGLAAAYGSRKVYKLYKDNQEELES